MSFTKKIGLVSAISLASVIVSLVYTLALAHYFGVSRELEIFFAASQLFAVFVALTQAGQLTEAFIPIFHELESKKGVGAAYAAFSILINWILLGTILLALFVFSFATPLVDLLVPGFSEDDKTLAVLVVMALSPLVSFQVVMAFMKAIANAKSLFGWPETLSLIGSLLQLLILVCFKNLGIWALVWGLILAVTVQLVAIYIVLRTCGYRHRWAWSHSDFSPSVVFKRLLSTSLYSIGAQLAGVAVTAVLSSFPQGVYAAYTYALRMRSKVESVILRPISIVFFTRFSEAHAAGSTALRAVIELAMSRTLVLVAFAVVVMYTAAGNFMLGLLESENFKPDKILMTTQFLSAHILSFVFIGFAQIFRKVLVSLGYFDRLYYLLSAGQFLNAGLIWFFVSGLGEYAVFTIIFLAALMPTLVTTSLLFRYRRDMCFFYDATNTVKLVCVVLIAVLAVNLSKDFIVAHTVITRIENLVMGVVVLFSALTVTTLAAILFQVDEVKALKFFLGKR